MGEFNEAATAAAELERVQKKLPTLFDRDVGFYPTLEKRPVEKISARDMRIPLEIRSGGYFGHFNPDGGALGTGAGPKLEKGVIGVEHLRYAIQWTKKAEWATDDARKAVVNTVRRLTANAMKDFRRHVDCLCMTAGQGLLGEISVAANDGGKDLLTLGNDGWGARLFRFGQKVTVYLNDLSDNFHTSGATGVNVEIDKYDIANKQIRLPQTTGLVAGSPWAAGSGPYLGVEGMQEDATFVAPVAILGIPYHHSSASTGTWLGLARADNPEIRSNRVNAASAGLALPFPRQALNKIGDRVGLDNSDQPVAWMHPCQKQAYEEIGQLVSIINKQAREQGLDMYFSDDMQMAGAPVKVNYSWDKRRIDFIINSVWGRAEMHPASFYTVGGRKFFELRSIADGSVKTSQVFYITISFNMYSGNPQKGAYIDGLAVPAGY